MTDIDGRMNAWHGANIRPEMASRFLKGMQPLTPFKGRNELMEDEYDAEHAALEGTGLDDWDKDDLADAASWVYGKSPQSSIDAYRNKMKALEQDVNGVSDEEKAAIEDAIRARKKVEELMAKRRAYEKAHSSAKVDDYFDFS